MGQECIYKITVISPLSELARGFDIICEKYDNPQGRSFVFLTADQFGLNTDNIFDLDSFSSLVLASQSTIEQFIIIFGMADITVEYVDFEYKLYNDFDLNRIEPKELRDKTSLDLGFGICGGNKEKLVTGDKYIMGFCSNYTAISHDGGNCCVFRKFNLFHSLSNTC